MKTLPVPYEPTWRDEARHAYDYLRVRPWQLGAWLAWVILAAGLLVSLASCGGLKPETRAALDSLSGVVGKACAAGSLDASDCDAARGALERLGLDLTEAQESVAMAWQSAAPLAMRIAEVLFRLVGV